MDTRDFGRGYSLWLIPDEAVRPRAQGIIDMLAQRFGSPRFEPHVTLVGTIIGDELEVRRVSEEIARGIGRMEAEFSGPACMEEYFKAMVVKLEKTEELQRSNDMANEMLKRAKTPDYMPHMSLAYTNVGIAEREAVMASLPMLTGICRLDKLELWHSTGKVTEWRKVSGYDLR